MCYLRLPSIRGDRIVQSSCEFDSIFASVMESSHSDSPLCSSHYGGAPPRKLFYSDALPVKPLTVFRSVPQAAKLSKALAARLQEMGSSMSKNEPLVARICDRMEDLGLLHG